MISQQAYRFAGGESEFPHARERIVERDLTLRARIAGTLPEPANYVVESDEPLFGCAVFNDHS